MDLLLEKIEDLKRHAELLQRTSPYEKGARRCEIDTQTPLSKKAKRAKGIFGTPGHHLQNGSSPSPSSLHLDYEEDGDWVSAFKAKAQPWTGVPLVVLSLFDGLGGIWQALTNLGIPFSGYSSEVLQSAIHVVKTRHPSVKHVGDIRKLKLSDIPEKVDLVIGGFPCQDLSIMGKKEGLHGRRSKLFFDLLRVLRDFKPKWFLVENVASMSWIDREEITRHLKLPPLELDSEELTASKRRRFYWTNIPHPPHLPRLRDHPTAHLQHCLQGAIALEHKCGVILCSNLYKGSTARLEYVLDSKTKKPRYMIPTEVEVLLGYPRDYTNVVVKKKIDQEPIVRSPKLRTGEEETAQLNVDVSQLVADYDAWTPKAKPQPSPVQPASTRQLRKNRMSRNFFSPPVWETKVTRQDSLKENERWFLLGNTFSVKVITYLTSPLLKSTVRSQGEPVNIIGSVKEEELSAMEPGDVWALFNDNARPNWYAVIQSRTGDRFSAIPDHSHKKVATKLPLKVEMQYLELTGSYLQKEEDEWNTRQGAGLFKLRPVVDTQDSWQAFSHRVTSFVKFEDTYFVYPGNDEVWSIYDPETLVRYFVYVVGRTINCAKLQADKPGQEEFVARCIILMKTTEHEVYRKTDTEVEFTDLEHFEFRVPFHLKHEAGLLKVEVSGVKSRRSLDIDRGWTGKKGKGKKGQEESDDDDLIDDEADDDAAEENDEADGLTAEELMAGDELQGIDLNTPLADANVANEGTSYGTPDGSAESPLEV